MNTPENQKPAARWILNDRKSVVLIEKWVTWSFIRKWPSMKLVVGFLYGEILMLLWVSASLYPASAEWAKWASGVSLWFGGLTFAVACSTKPFMAKLTGFGVNTVALLASYGALAGYLYGQKWCMILTVVLASFCGIISFLITRFYPPDPQV